MITKHLFGKTKAGEEVWSYILKNQKGMEAEILTLGGVLRILAVPAPEGLRDVVLGFDSVLEYEQQDKYIGAAIGRVANRIGGGTFRLNGIEYRLPKNTGNDCLHGGEGFHQRVWKDEVDGEALILKYISPDGESGFPAALSTELRYCLTPENGLVIEFTAACDGDTPVNLTTHGYFNLSGHDAGTIYDHWLEITGDSVTVMDENLITTGEFLNVTGTPFDFRQGKPIGADIHQKCPQLIIGGGYDHNYVLNNSEKNSLHLAARVKASGLTMECFTNQPGLQFYSGNFLDGDKGKNGAVYGHRSAFCLETQNFPDAVNHENFPESILKPGQTYKQITVYKFSEE